MWHRIYLEESMEILLISLFAIHFHMSKISLCCNILETSIHKLASTWILHVLYHQKDIFLLISVKIFSPHSDPFLTLLGVTTQKHYRKANFKVLMILQNYYWNTMTSEHIPDLFHYNSIISTWKGVSLFI